MSTPRIEVYQIERALALGVASVLLAQGLNDPNKQQDTAVLVTPRAEIKVVSNGNQIQGAGGVHQWIKQDDIPVTKWVDGWTGSLFVKTVTRRGSDVPQDHYGALATVRYVLLTQRQAVSDAMQFHSLAHVHETGSTPTIETSGEDQTTLSFAVTVRIMFEEKQDEIFI